MSRRVFIPIGCLFFAVLSLWPAIYNGQPFFFSDSTAYMRSADAAVQKLTGVSTPWTVDDVLRRSHSVSSVKDKTVLAGRSIYYGALLYMGERTGGFWLAVAVQASLLMTALLLALRLLDLTRWPYFAALAATVIGLTAAPLYVSFLMPDIFAGLTILACGLLLTCDFRKRRAQLAFWSLLLAFALTLHTTHVILTLGFFLLGVLLYAVRRRLVQPLGLGVLGAALVIAFAAGAAFNFAILKLVGEPPLAPPFLMARLIDDGPGYRELVDGCPQNGFVVCRFLDRLPLASDEFLWSSDPTRGVFATAAPDVRRALSKEQFKFALAVIRHDPWAQLKVSAQNALDQSLLVGVDEFDYDDEAKATFAEKVPPATFKVMLGTPAYRDSMPSGWLTGMSYGSAVAGLGALLFLFARQRANPLGDSRRAVQVAALVALGVVVNAAICGMMSGPHNRYEARLVWLLPAMALILHFKRYEPWWTRLFGGSAGTPLRILSFGPHPFGRSPVPGGSASLDRQ